MVTNKMKTNRSLRSTVLTLLTVPLAFSVFGAHIAHGYITGTRILWGTASTDPDNPTEYDWHDRGTWGIDTSWLEPGDSRYGIMIPGLPTDYDPDYNIPATINPNDPGTSAIDPNALGPNPVGIAAVVPPSFVHNATINASPDFPVSIINIDHDVELGFDASDGNQDVRQTSARFGGTGFGDLNSFGQFVVPTGTVNWRDGDFTAIAAVWLGSNANDYHATLNLTSSGTFQVGNSDQATNPGESTNSDATLRMGKGFDNALATVNQSAGSVILSGGLVMGVDHFQSNATYNLSGGTLATQTLDPLADQTSDIDMGLSDDALATFNQTGGTVTTDSRIVIGGYAGSMIFGSLQEEQATGVYNIGAGASTDGDFDFDGDVDGDDFLEWQTGGSPGGIGSGDLGLWQTNFGATGGGGGGTATLNQGVGTSNEGANKGAIVVGSGGHGTLNIDGSTDDVVIQANAIVVAADAQLNPGGIGTAGDSTGLVKITGEGAMITVDDFLTVGEGIASFEYISASGISSIDVGGEVYIEGATLTVDLTTSPPAAGDLLLIDVGSEPIGGIGTFAGLVQGAVVPNSGGRSISYTYGDGNDIGLVAPSIAAVPEPTSAVLCLLATTGLVCRGRRSASSKERLLQSRRQCV